MKLQMSKYDEDLEEIEKMKVEVVSGEADNDWPLNYAKIIEKTKQYDMKVEAQSIDLSDLQLKLAAQYGQLSETRGSGEHHEDLSE